MGSKCHQCETYRRDHADLDFKSESAPATLRCRACLNGFCDGCADFHPDHCDRYEPVEETGTNKAMRDLGHREQANELYVQLHAFSVQSGTTEKATLAATEALEEALRRVERETIEKCAQVVNDEQRSWTRDALRAGRALDHGLAASSHGKASLLVHVELRIRALLDALEGEAR